MRSAVERIAEDYSRIEMRSLAVRGTRLHLGWSRYSNDSGFESTGLWVHEVDDDELIVYQCRFDEDDFAGAYRELEERYYAGEGAAFAESGAIATEWVLAVNRGDLDLLFGELTEPEMRFEIRSSSALPDSSAAEARAALEDFYGSVGSAQTWHSAVCWVSANCCVCRNDREASGHDGEHFAWTRLSVCEFRGGRMVSECEFDLDDEDAAFAYAQERVRAAPSRLAINNSASRTWAAMARTADTRDFDAGAAWFAPSYVYDDRRRLTGNPIEDMRTAMQRIADQYTDYEFGTLAVRGDRLQLGSSRFLNESGFESNSLYVHEVGEDGRVIYQCRFDEDDFESAYRELEKRYYADEGAAFAESGAVATEFELAVVKGDFDRVFNELIAPDFYVENRSRSVLSDHRSASDFRATTEALAAMVDSMRMWSSAMCWLSPSCGVSRSEREATGRDGEKYAWSDLDVFVIRDGRVASAHMFDLDDEAAAFAYAQERARLVGED
jgi:ketosteroid isomerase-like protein